MSSGRPPKKPPARGATTTRKRRAPALPGQKAKARPATRTRQKAVSRERVLVLYDAEAGQVALRHKDGHQGQSVAASLADAPAVAAALEAAGHRAYVHKATRDPRALLEAVRRHKADVVFNLCDTLGGKGDHALVVPAVLEASGVRVAGATAAGLALSRRKHDVKAILCRDGIPTPRYQVIVDDDDLRRFHLHLAPPVIVKLAGEHASVGLEQSSVCFDEAATRARCAFLRERFGQALVIEEYVDGREFYVSFAGDPAEALPPMEHSFDDVPQGFLKMRTFDTKWFGAPGLSGERGGAPVDRAEVPRRASAVPSRFALGDLVALCRHAFVRAGCRDWGRVDVRIDRGGVPLVIDVTPNTYLGPSGPCAQAAAQAGLSLSDFVARIVEGALRRRI